MTVDMENRLRAALHARAEQVDADPRLWAAVQQRLRRGRRRRAAMALAGVAAVAALGVVVPGMLDGTEVELDNPPIADQPDDGDVQEPEGGGQGGVDDTQPTPDAQPDPDGAAATPVDSGVLGAFASVDGCEPSAPAAVWSLAGDLWLVCTDGEATALSSGSDEDRAPTVAPDGGALVFQRTPAGEPFPLLVHLPLDQPDGQPTVMGGGSLPTFAPDGRIAYVQDPGDGRAFVHVAEPFREPEIEVIMDVAASEFVDLSWDVEADRLLVSRAVEDGVEVWVVPLDGAVPQVVLDADDGYRAVAVAGDGTLAGLRLTDSAALELVLLDRGLLDGGDAQATSLATLSAGDAERITLHPVDRLRATSGQDGAVSWEEEGGASWAVGDGTRLLLVGADGSIVDARAFLGHVAGDSNPAEAEKRREAEDARARERALQTAQLTNTEIRAAITAGDLDALHARMAPDFNYSFGAEPDRDGAVAYLEEHPELLEQIPVVLTQPRGVIESDDGPLFVWPRAHALDPADWTDEDLASMRTLGATDEMIAAWRGTGYAGPRIGITGDGVWAFFVAGD